MVGGSECSGHPDALNDLKDGRAADHEEEQTQQPGPHLQHKISSLKWALREANDREGQYNEISTLNQRTEKLRGVFLIHKAHLKEPGSGSGTGLFRQWLTRCQQK